MHKHRRRLRAVRIYTDKGADLVWLKGRTCAVIGFGAKAALMR